MLKYLEKLCTHAFKAVKHIWQGIIHEDLDDMKKAAEQTYASTAKPALEKLAETDVQAIKGIIKQSFAEVIADYVKEKN